MQSACRKKCQKRSSGPGEEFSQSGLLVSLVVRLALGDLVGSAFGAPLHAVLALPSLISCSFERVSNDLLIILRHLSRAKLVGQFVDLAGEAER